MQVTWAVFTLAISVEASSSQYGSLRTPCHVYAGKVNRKCPFVSVQRIWFGSVTNVGPHSMVNLQLPYRHQQHDKYQGPRL